MASIWGEVKRRNVVKVAVAYAIVGWLLLQVADTVLPTFSAPVWVNQVFTLFIILGFPVALILAWAFEMTPEGVKPPTQVDTSVGTAAATGGSSVTASSRCWDLRLPSWWSTSMYWKMK